MTRANPSPLPESGGQAAYRGLFPGLDGDIRKDLGALLPLIEKTFPVPARFRRTLAADVAELSRLLTSARGERPLSYLNRPPLLSAYLRYFLPWNLYRLCRLLPGLDLPLAPEDTVIDLGSGPLSFPIGLWLCRRDLRAIPLKFRCLDRSKTALEAGKKLFAALAPSGAPWTIQTIHGDLGAFRSPAAALVTAFNFFNEPFQAISPGNDEGQRRFAQNQAALLAGITAQGGRLLIIEPGTPPAGRFISLLREALISRGRPPLSPCTHPCPCPFPALLRNPAARRGGGPAGEPGKKFFPGGNQGASPASKAKWCHFAFNTEEAPAALQRLSAAAGIPKERATLSFLLAGPQCGGIEKTKPAEQSAQTVRVISSPFPAGRGPETWGRYVCGETGMALLRGEKSRIEAAESGTLLTAAFTGEQDPKSGAPVCTAKNPQQPETAGIPGR